MFTCDTPTAPYAPSMGPSSVYLAEEALSLPPEQREQLARLLLASLQPDGTTVEELKARLQSRLADLRSGRDPGLSFDDVFGKRA